MPEPLSAGDAPRVIAFYLPQFHPIPENDAWWGKGFTEWTNVTKARALFRGHYQPHLPADLGFYDLRVAESREAQADLARDYGVTGFCYYHYWFAGKRLLHRPFDEVLTSGRPDFPFCLCWANENWTRVWDGGGSEVLMEQTYSEQDDLAHIRWLARAFADPRYIRVNNKPLFVVYRAHELPDIRNTTAIWRDECRRLGIGEVFLCRVDTGSDVLPPNEVGLDAAVEFQPEFATLGMLLSLRRLRLTQLRWTDLRFFLRRKLFRDSINVQNYRHLVSSMSTRTQPNYLRFPCVTPSWDNSPRRRQNPIVFVSSSPKLFHRWLVEIIAKLMKSRDTPRILFVNAWNEWAEGNHLEPDQRYGRSYLEALSDALQSCSHDAVRRSARMASNRPNAPQDGGNNAQSTLSAQRRALSRPFAFGLLRPFSGMNASVRLGEIAHNILSHWPIPPQPSKPAAHFCYLTMCDRAHWLMLRESLFSLYCAWNSLPAITVVSDGSWTANEFAEVFAWWPSPIKVLTREEICLSAQSAGFPEVADYVRESIWGLELATVTTQAKQRPVLYADADILWFKDPTRLLGNPTTWKAPRALRESNCHQRRDMALRHCPKVLEPPFVNAGMVALHGELMPPEILRSMVQDALPNPLDSSCQQTIVATAVKLGGELLPEKLCLVEFNDVDRLRSRDMSDEGYYSRHYVNWMRHLLYRDALRLRWRSVLNWNYFPSK